MKFSFPHPVAKDATRVGHPPKTLQFQSFQIFAEGVAEVFTFQGEFHGGFQEAEFVAGIVATAFVDIGIHFFFLQKKAHAVGELEFSASAGRGVGEAVEDGRGEDVAADDGEIRGRVFGFGLLDHVFDFEEAIAEAAARDRFYVEHAVGRNHFAFDDLSGQDGALGLVENLDHLLEAGDLGVDDVIGEEDGEGFVADEFAGHEDSMAEAESFFLANVGDVDHIGDGAHDLEQIRFVALFQHAFELIADIEVIFDGLLAAAGDDEDLIAAGGHGFFDAVLDDGLIDQRKHFLGLSFSCGQEAGAEACGGEYGFADFHGHKGSD